MMPSHIAVGALALAALVTLALAALAIAEAPIAPVFTAARPYVVVWR
jgi:hypothetical protein